PATRPLATLSYSPDGRLLVSSGWDGDVKLWNTRTNREVVTLHVDARMAHAAFSRDGARLVTCGDGGIVRIWDVASHGEIGPPFRPHQSAVNCAGFSPDGRWIATGGNDGYAKLT